MGSVRIRTTKATGEASGSPGKALRPTHLSAQAKRVSILLRRVSDPVRLSILLTLANGDHSVTEIGSIIAQGLSGTSHHLALLRHTGFIAARRQGKQNRYSLTDRGRWIADFVRTLLPGEKSRAGSAPTTQPIDPALLEDVAGFVDDPEGWFRTANPEFEGRRPIDLLGTVDEARLRHRIDAAKLGMFS